MGEDDAAFVLLPVLDRTVDGLVAPRQLRQTTLPLSMLALIMVAAIILCIGAFMSLSMRWMDANRAGLWLVGVISLLISIGLAFAYTAINQFQ